MAILKVDTISGIGDTASRPQEGAGTLRFRIYKSQNF